jgi:hypothetical protein
MLLLFTMRLTILHQLIGAANIFIQSAKFVSGSTVLLEILLSLAYSNTSVVDPDRTDLAVHIGNADPDPGAWKFTQN